MRISTDIWRVLILALLIMQAAVTKAQISNERQKEIRVTGDTLSIDTLSIIPSSFHVYFKGNPLDSSAYRLDFIRSLLILSDSLPFDSLMLAYKVFPVMLATKYAHKSTDMIRAEGSDTFTPYIIGSNRAGSDILSGDGLQKSGNISRGIAFGNSQNLSVNSALNLQLNGKLTDRYSLMASVSDDNIPIQPDGNTQQLQDFDQVYIQLYDERSKLIAGDFILRRPTGYFMNYFKRAQGAYVQVKSPPKQGKGILTVETSASVSKGRFSRNVIQGVEGNQGPYKLHGADNEPFIIVLAGTEAIYIDGRLMERGQDKDYTMDYNSSEITFTPRQFITKDRRIVAEFQYSEKRFARPMIQASISKEGKKGAATELVYLNLYSENDAKNQPLQQDLSQREKAVLSAAGDDLLSAVIPGVNEVAYTNNQVLYAIRDSLGFDSVFYYSTDSTIARFRISFTLVGTGKGDYTEDGFTANGRKFKWIEPTIAGSDTIPAGDYAPVILLATPKKKQMITGGVRLNLSGKRANPERVENNLTLEGAFTNNDLNTFSTIDSDDDLGVALKALYSWKRKETNVQADTGVKRIKNTWTTAINYEYTSRDFSPIERFREVEFDRNWNTQGLNLVNDQNIVGATVGLGRKKWGNVSAGADAFSLGNEYDGYKFRSAADISNGTLTARINASLLNTQGLRNTRFLRHKSDISKGFGKMKIGFKDEHELNEFRLGNSDSLSMASYQFYDWQVSAGTADTTKTQITVFYRDRWDRRTDSLSLVPVARADQYGALMGIRGKRGNALQLNVSNRRLRIIDPERYSQQPENTLLARLEYTFNIKDNFIQGNTFYEIGSGLEQKREFIYLEVPAGQGSYVWIDYNQNAVKDLNEFEIAQFSYEANYIRVFVQTNQYIRTFSNQFSQTITLNPARLWKKQDKQWQKTLSVFSDQVSYKVDRKTNREQGEDRFNPFLTEVADSNLLALNGSFRNIFFFNKTNPKFGMDHTYQEVRNKNLLSDGFESRSDQYNQLGLRWNFIQDFTFSLEAKKGLRRVASDFLSGRNYAIDYAQMKPKITWQPGVSGRLSILGEYGDKVNETSELRERATILKGGAELTLNSPDKGSFQATMNIYRITYTGSPNNSLAFDMLEGLNAGRNYVWTANVQRTVAKNLQLNLLYNGRKPEGIPTIHSGGVQLRAFF